MATEYTCARCGTKYPAEVVEQWGENGVGDGYGSDARCFALRETRKGAFEVCRGQLAASIEQADNFDALASRLNDDVRFSRPFALKRDGKITQVKAAPTPKGDQP